MRASSNPRWVWVLCGVASLEVALLADRAGAVSTALVMLAMAIFLTGFGVLFAPRSITLSVTSWRVARAMVLILGTASVIRATALFAAQPDLVRWIAGMVGWLMVAVAFLTTSVRYRKSLRIGLLVLFITFGFMTITSHVGGNDVFVFQQQGSEHLLDGVNPYSAQYPNIYPPSDAESFYGPDLFDERSLRFGFPYTPLSLFMAVPGYVVGGDFRYGLLASGAILLGILTKPGNGQLGQLSGSLFALFPLHFGFGGMFGFGWTEPFVTLLLALVVLAATRKSQWMPPLFGLLLASKLTLIFVGPLYFLIDDSLFGRHGRARRLTRILLTGAAVTLPLAIWDWNRFWFSVVELQFFQPIRPDALTFTVWLSNTFGPLPSFVFTVAPFLTAATALLLVFRHPDRSPAGFAFACGLVALAWLVVTKQSFLNHYYFAFAALLLGVAFSNKPTAESASLTQVGADLPLRMPLAD